MTKLLHYLFVRDWMLKFFSLALAVLTWLAVSFSLRQKVVEVPGHPAVSERTYYDLPVLIVSAAADVHDFRVKPAEVDVTVQGEETLLNNLQSRHIRVLVDLSNVATTNALKKRIEVVAPSGITHVRIEPDEVEIIPPAAPEPKIRGQ
jgi:YbbR domain-containing protein